ncbi:hypothetical protein SAMN05428975_3374 [Mucilaginibacter sp. OK268]|uniref:hypothetical protein n=1 Tax=Mucilaginibacter sp. OK268 TaxID=1881048 RepID=UPI000890AA27|nr:hypothetical protein [Mucilaginibacter sp. OK268]SDP88693.1 hypothetical protein SAMN05428975_3374 [Mucilaginibacter sp. OK268]
MILFSRRNLHYTDYKWSVYNQNDPRVNGKPDTTPFTKDEGNEVVYLINKLMILWDYRFANTGNKMEKLIHDQLPPTITLQEDVQQWLKANLKF